MLIRPCPICKKPVAWEVVASRPFCSERCRLMDLGTWSGEGYRIPENPALEDGEGWSDGEGSGGSTSL